MVLTEPDARSCVVAAGAHWQNLPEEGRARGLILPRRSQSQSSEPNHDADRVSAAPARLGCCNRSARSAGRFGLAVGRPARAATPDAEMAAAAFLRVFGEQATAMLADDSLSKEERAGDLLAERQ